MIILWVMLFISIHMSVFWVLYRVLKNPSVIDVGWASVLTLSGWIYILHATPSVVSILSGILLLVWGIRLGGYLWFSRVGAGHQDKRYTQLSENWKMAKALGFFLNFQLQGLLAWPIAVSFYFISMRTEFFWWDSLGFGMVIIGLIGESLADYQLQNYKRKPVGAVCQAGLWRYSRHPNYFFDWLSWLGFSVIALSGSLGFIALISPLTLYMIMVYVTGPMTEAGSLASRGEAYEQYQQQTQMFFPGPVKPS